MLSGFYQQNIFISVSPANKPLFRIRTELPLRIRTLNTYPSPDGCHEFVKNTIFTLILISSFSNLFFSLPPFKCYFKVKICYILIFIYKIFFFSADFYFLTSAQYHSCDCEKILESLRVYSKPLKAFMKLFNICLVFLD
jgi:hypothetical protein